MAEPKYSSSDIPDFSTYPGGKPELPEHGTESHYRYARYGSDYDPRATALDHAARRIGWTLGRIVGTLEQFRADARERIHEAQEHLQEQADEATSEAKQTLSTAKKTARHKVEEARRTAAVLRRRAIQDYPIQVILAAGAFGVLAGAGIRTWRENRG
jgi:ElaB/YqjD/DUF883 family membrane-anchored ribosome-binding protein